MVQTGFVAYGAAKAALNMLTRNLAAELAPFPVARLRTQAEVDRFLSRAERVT